jgi:hypothetical protein
VGSVQICDRLGWIRWGCHVVMPPTGIVDLSVALVAGLTQDSCAGPVIGVIKVIGICGISYQS